MPEGNGSGEPSNNPGGSTANGNVGFLPVGIENIIERELDQDEKQDGTAA